MRKILMVILTVFYQIGIGTGFTTDCVPTDNLGMPSAQVYNQNQITSRVPWDMIINDGKLYIGGGDFGDNTGPVDVWCCDLETNKWSVSGTLNDEAIGKFIQIGDRVYAPGFDPKGSPAKGNFHWLEDGVWYSSNQLPDAVHNFDIIEYDNKLFFAIGTKNAESSPVKVSYDQGTTFQDVPFYKDGSDILDKNEYDFHRVYDFFVTDSGLYCMLLSVSNGAAQYYEFFHYIDGAFHFSSTHAQIGLKIQSIKQEPISSKITYNGYCYVAARYLTRTKDFQSAEQIVLPNNEYATDLLIDNDTLYILSAQTRDDGCTVRIYAYIYNSFLYPVAAFDSENLSVSFEKKQNVFYIGLGNQGYSNEIAGSIHKITIPEITLKMIEDCPKQ